MIRFIFTIAAASFYGHWQNRYSAGWFMYFALEAAIITGDQIADAIKAHGRA